MYIENNHWLLGFSTLPTNGMYNHIILAYSSFSVDYLCEQSNNNKILIFVAVIYLSRQKSLNLSLREKREQKCVLS